MELKLKKEGDKAPDFSVVTNGGEKISLADFKGQTSAGFLSEPIHHKGT
jgi:peroxiredoxin